MTLAAELGEATRSSDARFKDEVTEAKRQKAPHEVPWQPGTGRVSQAPARAGGGWVLGAVDGPWGAVPAVSLPAGPPTWGVLSLLCFLIAWKQS